MNNPRKLRLLIILLSVGLLIGMSSAVRASLAHAEEILFVSAVNEGTTFTANSTGVYRFTIAGGASEVTPPSSQPNYPELWGWQTQVLIYKNRPIEWGAGEHANPVDWDFSVGDATLQPTYQAAEQVGLGRFVDVPFQANQYAILVVNDGQCYFLDNHGGITFSAVDIPQPVPIPAAFWLEGSTLMVLWFVGGRAGRYGRVAR